MLSFVKCGNCLRVQGSDGESQGVFDGDVLTLEHAKMFEGDLVIASALRGPARRHVGRLRFSGASSAGVFVGNVFYRKDHVNLWRVSIRPARSRRAA